MRDCRKVSSESNEQEINLEKLFANSFIVIATLSKKKETLIWSTV